MSVKIHGNNYTTVAERVKDFRKDHKQDLGIDTEILKNEGKEVVIRARVIDKDGSVLGSGIAREIEGSSNINKTSHFENCETSAIGRALASFGYGVNGEYASANEVETAIEGQKQQKSTREVYDMARFKKDRADMEKMVEEGKSTWVKIEAGLIKKYDVTEDVKEEILKTTPPF